MTVAVYPNGIVPWTSKVDKLTTVAAADTNTLAAEISAVESVLGTNPHIENAPPTGNAITYSTMGARLHDVQMGNQLPIVSLSNSSFHVKFGTFFLNGFISIYDPFRHYNGTDITIQTPGWYVVTATQTFDWAASGFHMIQLLVGNSLVTEDFWGWDFPENKPKGAWNNQPKMLSLSWQGIVQKGQRLSVVSRNASSVSYVNVRNATLKASFHRSVPLTARG